MEDKEINVNSLKHAPEFFIANILPDIELKTIKNGFFAKFNNCFYGHELMTSFKNHAKFGQITSEDKEIEEIFNVYLQKKYLVPLKTPELESFDSGEVFTFPYFQNSDPFNSVIFHL